jgi:hypothetical protein
MRVAILGTVPASRNIAPFDDPEVEIWCCSPGNRGDVIPRVTRWFELHGVVDLKGEENRSWAGEYFAWLRAQPWPVYMQEPNDLVPEARVFPAKRLLREFGHLGRIAFTSSISWMIGFAILEGAKEIGVFGVDMAATEEAYGNQKSGCQVMMAIAHERGIKVNVPLESCLASPPPLYGYAEATRMGRRLLVREEQCRREIANLEATISRLTQELAMFRGALDQVQYMRRTFVDGEDAEIDLPGDRDNVETMPVRATAGGLLVPKFAVE